MLVGAVDCHDARIYFPDREFLGICILVLDNPADIPAGITHDPTVTGWFVKIRRQ